MAKFMILASYTAEGIQGLIKDKASGRKAAVSRALEAVGGKIETFHFAFGEDDVYVVADLPDNISAAAVSVRVAATGLVRIRTVPLLTVEEMDKAVEKTIEYRPPGR